MREVIDLNGLWRFLPDLDPEYHCSAQYARTGWDRRHWQVVRVPACWNLYGERYALYEGVGWFARSFCLSRWEAGMIGVLRFGAVNYEAQVFVNGAMAGEHRGGYTGFTLDVSHLLRAGENELVVRVDNRRNRILLPACMGWFNYGGIHREVTLEVTRQARFEWVGVDAIPVGGGAEGHLHLEWRSLEVDFLAVQAVLRDAAGDTVWQDELTLAGAVGEMMLPWHLPQAQAWSPATPALYEMEVTLSAPCSPSLDRLVVPFGVRKVDVEGATIFLNGQPIWLKGICYLEDHPAVGIAYDETITRQDLDDIQELGANALRCHVPLHERALRECDRRGLLVWSEVPIYCLAPGNALPSAFSDLAYRQLANSMLREMVRAAYSHPSIIIWSLGNECQVAHPEAAAFFRELAATVRSLDSTRLLAYASLYGEMASIAELLDVIGVNEYWGWYDRLGTEGGHDRPLLEGITEHLDGSRTIQVAALDLSRLQQELAEKARQYNKPIILSEFGADAVPGYRSSDRQLWSEDYQAHLLQRTFAIMRTASNVCGAFPFLYQDYPDPSKWVDSHWQGLNLKGIVTYDRQRKLAFDALRRVYADAPWNGQVVGKGCGV